MATAAQSAAVAVTAGWPDLMLGRTNLTLYEGGKGLHESDFINNKNTSLEIVAEVETGDKPVNGVVVAQGGTFGGWSLYVKDGTPVYTYNYVGIDITDIKATAKLPKGKSTVKMDFAYDGGDELGKGGTVTLYINDKAVGSGKIAATEFSLFSTDETAGVGSDPETTVSDQYTRATSEFTGTIDKVTITLK